MTVRGARPEDFDKIIAVQLRTFPSLSEEMIRAFALNDPWGEDEHARVCVMDDEIASVVRIAKRPIRLGGTTVWLGGISGVGTLRKHRGKGGASACMRDALGYMKQQGMPISALFCDINRFYDRLGYQTLHVPWFRLSLGDVPAPNPGEYTLRLTDLDRDVEAVAAIFDRFNERRGTTLARTLEYWRAWPTWAVWEAYLHETLPAFLIAERDGEPVAYSRAKLAPRREKVAELLELCCVPGGEGASLPLFARTCELARDWGFKKIRAFLPTDHPVLSQLRATGVPVERTEFTNMMWRVVDLPGLLEPLLPDMSRFCSVRGEWTIKVNDQALTLRCAKGSVQLAQPSTEPVEIGPATLVALLSGHELPVTSDVANLRENHPDLLGVLNIGWHFPAPVYWYADDF